MRIYLFHEGIARFATTLYQEPNTQNMKDIYMHLTNYSINKNNKNFVPNDDDWGSDGHKRSLN